MYKVMFITTELCPHNTTQHNIAEHNIVKHNTKTKNENDSRLLNLNDSSHKSVSREMNHVLWLFWLNWIELNWIEYQKWVKPEKLEILNKFQTNCYV